MIRRNAFLRTSSSKWLARQVRAKFGGPGDRFLGVIELAEKRNTDSLNYSESLYQAALQRVEKEISKLSLSDTFDRQPGRRAGVCSDPLPVRHARLLLYLPRTCSKHLFAMGHRPGQIFRVRPSLGFPMFPLLFTPQKEKPQSFRLPWPMIQKKNPIRFN